METLGLVGIAVLAGATLGGLSVLLVRRRVASRRLRAIGRELFEDGLPSARTARELERPAKSGGPRRDDFGLRWAQVSNLTLAEHARRPDTRRPAGADRPSASGAPAEAEPAGDVDGTTAHP
jgi:hypothetical protein